VVDHMLPGVDIQHCARPVVVVGHHILLHTVGWGVGLRTALLVGPQTDREPGQ
jgi:hypothetical protein